MARVQVLPAEARSPGRHETDAALSLAKRMPRLVLEARRVAATLAHGIHGRRRAGTGESFWQFRPFVTGESSHRVDWRRSGRDDRLYVREREWETAHTVWLWMDRSASMGFVSDLAQAPAALVGKIGRELAAGACRTYHVQHRVLDGLPDAEAAPEALRREQRLRAHHGGGRHALGARRLEQDV